MTERKKKIMREWDTPKNKMTFEEGLKKKREKYYWLCTEYHHLYSATIYSRLQLGSNCPYCSGRLAIPGISDLLSQRPDIAAEWDYEKNIDGPEKYKVFSNVKVYWKCRKGHSYSAYIYARTNSNSGCPYCSGRKVLRGENDLKTLRPDLALLWDDKSNEKKPENYTVGSSEEVYWNCNEGHQFRAKIKDVVKRKNPCLFCAGILPIKGVNDLGSLRPDLVKQWNYKINKKSPENYTEHSGEYVYWICEEGHEYKAKISSRTLKNKPTGCPYCSGKKVIKGKTDLMTISPDIAAEWDYVANGELKPDNVSPNSNKMVSWICRKGHKYKAVIYSRKNSSMGCPYCSGKKPIIGETDFASQKPELLSEWDYKKNKIRPDEVTVGSGKYVFWLCNKGHSYQSRIENRTINGRGCPYCAGRKPIIGENDLLTLRPDLAEEWDYENNKKGPEYYAVSSNEQVYWLCKEGHRYKSRIYSRTKKSSTGCPYCAGNLPIKGVTDLETVEKDLMLDWNWNKNKRTPDTFLPSSNVKVWWKCHLCSYEWYQYIFVRKKGQNCPRCQSRIREADVNLNEK